jgi:hypothetical protein
LDFRGEFDAFYVVEGPFLGDLHLLELVFIVDTKKVVLDGVFDPLKQATAAFYDLFFSENPICKCLRLFHDLARFVFEGYLADSEVEVGVVHGLPDGGGIDLAVDEES